MKQSKDDKLLSKRLLLIERTAAVLGTDKEEAERLLCMGRTQSLRINTLKAYADILTSLRALGWEGEQYSWCPEGYTIDHGLREIRDSAYAANGEVYIQNAASWLPVLALAAQPGDMVLDVAAAPGGKTSHIAARTNNQAALTVNDNSRTRLVKMQKNFERLGVSVDRFTLLDGTKLSRKLDGVQFDRILLDAPCSGEGLINLSDLRSLETWSVAAIKRLQSLQRKLLSEAWQLLKPGGTLVYSTCTMAPEENEQVIEWLLKKAPDVRIVPLDFDLSARVPTVKEWNGKVINRKLQGALRVQPSKELEAFFVCKLQKLPHSDSEYYQAVGTREV